MTTAFKSRLIVLAFALFSVWPVAHHLLVLRYDINPWKLAGCSMYCVTKAPPVISLREIRNRRLHHIDVASNPSVTESRRRYQQCYFHLGRLCSHRRLASAVFDAEPSLSGLLIVVHVPRLERTNAMIYNERLAWACARGRTGSAPHCEPRALPDKHD